MVPGMGTSRTAKLPNEASVSLHPFSTDSDGLSARVTNDLDKLKQRCLACLSTLFYNPWRKGWLESGLNKYLLTIKEH